MWDGIKIIDTHCHVYPEKIAAKAIESTAAFYQATAALDGLSSTLRTLDTPIDHFLLCSVATTPHQVHSINRFLAGEVQRAGGRFSALGALHPESADMEADIREIQALGLHGAKLHPDIQGFALDDERFMALFARCEGRLPLLLHTGDSRYDYSNPNRLRPVLEAFPKLTIVAAHLGCYTVWERCGELLGYENLWVDCSSSLAFLPPEEGRRLIRAFGADRVLFGTDYPMGQPRTELERLLALGLEREELEQILHRNAEKVFGL